MPLPSIQLTLVAAIILPTFFVFLSYVVNSVWELNSKWEANKDRRRQRRAAHNVKLSFDSYGYIVKESVDQFKHQKLWERVLGSLHALSSWSFSNLDIIRYRSTLASARADADKYMNDIHDALSRRIPDAGLVKTLKETDDLLTKLEARQFNGSSTDVTKVCLALEAELKRVAGLKLPGVSTGALLLEPIKVVKGVNVRRAGLLHAAVEIRDKFDIGSRRLLLALVSLVLTAGLVRFLGFIPAMVVGIFLLIEVLLDVLQACEFASWQGFMETLKVSMAGRISAPVVIALMMAQFLVFSKPRPMSNAELQDKGTFLPAPPQYLLEEVASQTFYVPAIFGIMHGTLVVLVIIPLTVCYRSHAWLVQACPRLRFLIPDNPVWLHRMLGYSMSAGLIIGAVIWVVFQGLECVVFDREFTCEAFDPVPGPGLDVFRLRFLIVWPFTFFFIPLMASPTYPDVGASASATMTVHTAGTGASERGGCPLSSLLCGLCGGSSSASSQPTTCSSVLRQTLAAIKCMFKFIASRVTDIFLLVVPVAGIMLTIKLENFFPSWYIVSPVVLLHVLVKFRYLRFRCFGPFTCLDSSEEGPELFQRFWWEIAYSLHATAFLLVLAAALQIRGEIFFVCLPTWGQYFVDRILLFVGACRNRAPIIVGPGQSSHVVTRGKEKDAQPSAVRLIVKKPANFTYRAGQWCHVAYRRCGSYGCFPHYLPLCMNWHAFSLASCEEDDFLEFHIQVHGQRALVNDNSVVLAASKDQYYTKISRKERWLDWFFPYSTPFFGKMPATSRLGSSFKVKTSGVAMTLTSADASGSDTTAVGLARSPATDGANTFRMLKPQAQWTGKLWNAISWLQDRQSRGEDTSEEAVHIMGPYGTLPWVFEDNQAMMLIGAGVGFPSMGAMLRKCLLDNLKLPEPEQKRVCFIWTATKLEQLHLCFPGLLVDLARYVNKSSIDNLKGWLTIKIFISSFDAGDYLALNPGKQIFPEGGSMTGPLQKVRHWLLERGGGQDSDGTYIAQGSLGGSFADVLRNSLFMQQVIEWKTSLGICFCGPSELCSWIRTDVSNTILPVKVEFSSEVA